MISSFEIEDNGLDRDGFIRCDVSLNKIASCFVPVLEKVQRETINAFDIQLHSLYLYGSVATGMAIPVISDLDILLVFKNEPDQQIRTTVKLLERELSSAFRAQLREVGLAITYLSEVLDGDQRIVIECFIKHLCVCLYGEDLGLKFPKFKPTRAVAYGLNGDIRHVIKRAKCALVDSSTDSSGKTSMSISRNMIRTAFCLVMEEANCWTTDLKDCCSIFTSYYPEHSRQIRHLFEISQGALVSRDELLSILDDFGKWLSDEVERKLQTAE